MPQGLKGFQKGNDVGGRTFGSKNKTTLLKEERRAVFENRISEKWEGIIDKLKPEYIADQYMGKAPDELIVKGAIHIDQDIADKNEITPSTESDCEG